MSATLAVFVLHAWFGNLEGKILGLASGGGQQLSIFNALGAECTVIDNSSKQIENEFKIGPNKSFNYHSYLRRMSANLV